jgi:ATP-dependent DNA helicase RecQ
VDHREIARQTDLSVRKVVSVVNRLQDAGALETAADGDVQLAAGMDPRTAAEAAAEIQDALKKAQRERVDAMQRYAELTTCRREYLLNYFGDPFDGPCGNCDNDESDAGTRREVA